MKDTFNVPGVIGPHSAQAKAQGLEPLPYQDYKSFVTHLHKTEVARDSRQVQLDEKVQWAEN